MLLAGALKTCVDEAPGADSLGLGFQIAKAASSQVFDGLIVTCGSLCGLVFTSFMTLLSTKPGFKFMYDSPQQWCFHHLSHCTL